MSKFGYVEDRIQIVYFCTSDLPFEDSLVAIVCDAEVRERIGMLTKFEYICVYVEHIDNDKAEEGGGDKEGNRIEDDDYFADNDDESTNKLWLVG